MIAESPSIENPEVYKPVALSICRVLSEVNGDEDTHRCLSQYLILFCSNLKTLITDLG
jgi:hypothetical protein